jgi:hypothetical protein
VNLVWYAHETPAIVRRQRVHRHRALLDETRATAAILLAQGPPRAWHLSLEAAVAGIGEAIEKGVRDAEQLLVSAAARVRERAASLLDEDYVQVHCIAVSVEGQRLSLATAGSCRAYLQRGSEHRRLTTASDSKGLKNAFSFVTAKETLQDGDVLVFGPSHIFGVTGVAKMARLLQDRQSITPKLIARGLLSTTEAEQSGGAVVSLQVT